MTNRKLREVLLKKLGGTRQALSQRAQKLKEQYAMTTEDATYVIAQKEGIILDKYLDKETIDRVRSLLQDISISHVSLQPSPKVTRVRKESGKEERIIIVCKEFKTTGPVLPKNKILEAKEMAAIYPLLYVLENSIREVIDRIMTS